MMKVLIVDDSDDDVALLRHRLPRAQCVQARGLAEAAELLQSEKFSVCLLDVILGLRDGTEFLRVCRAQTPQLPAIVITGSSDPAIEERALTLGATDFLHKDQIVPAVLDRAIARAIAFPVRQEEALSTAIGRRRLLVIDDEPFMLKAIERALSKQHELVLCADAEAGLTAIESSAHSFDLILCDLHMPKTSGLELFQRVSALKPGPWAFALMTAGAITVDVEDATRRSRLPLLMKPFSNGELRAFIAEHARVR